MIVTTKRSELLDFGPGGELIVSSSHDDRRKTTPAVPAASSSRPARETIRAMTTHAEVDADQDARDLADCRASPLIKGAAATLAFAGVGSLMLALQALLLVGNARSELMSFGLALEVLLGILLLAMAVRLLKVRYTTTIAATVVAFGSAVALLAWSLLALSRGLFSLLGFAVPGLCVIAGVLGAAALGSARRASAARERLRRRGVSVGL
jgi:cation transport ATPase